jgi:hypothetical protein
MTDFIRCAEECIVELEQDGKVVKEFKIKYTTDFDHPDQLKDLPKKGDTEAFPLGEVPAANEIKSGRERFSDALIDAQNHCKKIQLCILFTDRGKRVYRVASLPPCKDCCPDQ